MTDRSEALRGHAAMFLFAAVISVSFTLGDIAAPWIDPMALSALRFTIAAMLVGVASAPHIRAVHFKQAWRYLVVGGLLAGYFILMFEALNITDPVSTSAVFTLTPIMSAIFGYMLMRQITTKLTACALLLAGTGAIWVIFRADIEAILGLRFGKGEQLFFIGCAMHALYAPIGRKLNRGEPLLVYTFGCICGGLIVTVLFGARSITHTEWPELPAIAWIAAVYLGVCATAGTVFLVQFATLRLPSAKVMAYGYLVPAFVILWEGLLGHGWIPLAVLPGVIAILTALIVLCSTTEPD
ncbi:hypothetical protein AB833_23575 [Chromatiales bacterium (ex Bugula neritina AB1)]|nr:hypothetical protein AB833_23575 [Chromatiales bacterium (ex Bugula neritina AB1)]